MLLLIISQKNYWWKKNWKTQNGDDYLNHLTNVTKSIANCNYFCQCVEGQKNYILQLIVTSISLKFIVVSVFPIRPKKLVLATNIDK
jgi:hypothetical protein